MWFRELPEGLYNSIDERLIHRIADEPFDADAIAREYHGFKEPTRSLVLWVRPQRDRCSEQKAEGVGVGGGLVFKLCCGGGTRRMEDGISDV